jgi:predicted RNase H-like nuclease
MRPIPDAGSVLGVDIGWSKKRRTSGVCRLDWDLKSITFTYCRASLSERRQTLLSMANRPLLVAAFDGPLSCKLNIIGRYRLAEQLLTRQLHAHIGKPGQSSSKVGMRLNHHANECATIIIKTNYLSNATHIHHVHASAIVEAFPSSFLGVLIEQPQNLITNRARRSDTFYCHLAQSGILLKLLLKLLPGRNFENNFNDATHHDERAAVVCALTALCVAAGNYTVVGDNVDGWIVLPPRSCITPFAWGMLLQNAGDGGLEYFPTA